MFPLVDTLSVKLRVHPPSGVHILATRCIDFETYATAVCIILWAYIVRNT